MRKTTSGDINLIMRMSHKNPNLFSDEELQQIASKFKILETEEEMIEWERTHKEQYNPRNTLSDFQGISRLRRSCQQKKYYTCRIVYMFNQVRVEGYFNLFPY